jgi:hypothetical protein
MPKAAIQKHLSTCVRAEVWLVICSWNTVLSRQLQQVVNDVTL